LSPFRRGKPERRGWIELKIKFYPPSPCGYSLQRETEIQVAKYSTPSSVAVHPSRGEFKCNPPPATPV